MRSLPMYLDRADAQLLVDWLSDDEEIAFLVPAGAPHSWRAVARVPGLADGEYALWHVAAGPLPLVQPLPAIGDPRTLFIADPWAGWTELRPGAKTDVPYFGPGCTASLDLYLHVRAVGASDGAEAIGVSSIQWIGNHYSRLGDVADQRTERWWNKLKRFAKKNAIRVPLGGPLDGPRPEIWAFAGARTACAGGRRLGYQ